MKVKMCDEGIDVYYGTKQALFGIDLKIPENKVTALIGPSGCGKSTFLRCLNRMNDPIVGARIEGRITLDDIDIYSDQIDVVSLRTRVGMVFQKPNPFPKSIYDNVAYGPRLHGLAKNKNELDEIVQKSLKRAGLFEEIKDRLSSPATGLSGGQQQRVGVARALATNPPYVLFDEPFGALDALTRMELQREVKKIHESLAEKTFMFVTHDINEALFLGQRVMIMHEGRIVQFATPEEIVRHPATEFVEQLLGTIRQNQDLWRPQYD